METLQRQLAKHGFDPGPVDGIYGERTAAAVRALQASNDHEATGELDRATLAALLAPEPPEEEIVPVRGEDEARTVEPAARPTHDVTTILGMLGAGVAFGILSAAALMRRDAAGAARETSRRSR